MESGSLKTNFKVKNKYGAFYTGGKIQFSENGKYMFCQNEDKVQVLEVSTGQVYKTIAQEAEDEVTSFILSPDQQMLVVAGRSLLLRQYDWKENKVARTWKAIHVAPVSCMSFDVTSTLLATGGSDSTIKVWDVIKQYCTHNLKGHSGVISIAEFHPDISKLQLFSAGGDYKVRVWDLQTSVCLAVLESHYSVITSLQFSENHQTLYCGGRDNIVSVWDLDDMKNKKTIPVYEAIEGLVLVSQGEDHSQLGIKKPKHPHFITAGAKGVLKVWDAKTSQCLHTLELAAGTSTESENEAAQSTITALSYNKELDTLNVVTYDHNILMYKMEDLSLHKQFVGYNDDILDIHFLGQNDSHLVVATNSELLKVFNTETWDCQILRGHTDTVMSLDVSQDKRHVVSASKDNTIRVWRQDEGTGTVHCVAEGQGHTNSVQSVAFSRLGNNFVVSGSQDLTLKLWPLPSDFSVEDKVVLHAKVTDKAHDKDINSISVSPNDKLIVTGSQDKTAKLWNASKLSLLGVFRGHRRGIWCVKFSPVDQCIATASADGTIKIWALSDYSCVKTLEGHESSVLQVGFISKGMQLISTGSDGLIKLWTIKSSECVNTYDQHEDKVWALAHSQDEDTVITGGGDSNILVWKDVTVEEEEEVRTKQVDFILKEQELQNLLQQKKYKKAIGLAINLDQPFRVLNIMKDILLGEDGKKDLETTIHQLKDYQIDSVIRYASTWNTNAKHCHTTQLVLSVILTRHTPEELIKMANFKSSLEGLIPYTERHCMRLGKVQQKATFVDYTWQCMRLATESSEKPLEKTEESEMEVDTETFVIDKKLPVKKQTYDSDSDSDDSVESSEYNTPVKDRKSGMSKTKSLLIKKKANRRKKKSDNEESCSEESDENKITIIHSPPVANTKPEVRKKKTVNRQKHSSESGDSDSSSGSSSEDNEDALPKTQEKKEGVEKTVNEIESDSESELSDKAFTKWNVSESDSSDESESSEDELENKLLTNPNIKVEIAENADKADSGHGDSCNSDSENVSNQSTPQKTVGDGNNYSTVSKSVRRESNLKEKETTPAKENVKRSPRKKHNFQLQDSVSEINAEKSSPLRPQITGEQMEVSPKENVQMTLRKRSTSDSVNSDNKNTDGESSPVNSMNTEKQSGSPQKKIGKKTLNHKHKSGSGKSDDADGDEESSPVMSMDTQEKCAEVRSPYTMHQSTPLKMVGDENNDSTMSSSVKSKSKLKEKEITPAKENVKKSPRKKHNFDLSGRLSEINAEKSSPARCRNTDVQMELSPKKNVQMTLRKRNVSDSVNSDNKNTDGESSPVKSMNTEKQSGSPQKKIVKKTLKHKQKSGSSESDDADGDEESSPVMRMDTQEQCGEVRSPYTMLQSTPRNMVGDENNDSTVSRSVRSKSKMKEIEITPAKENVKRSPRKKHNFQLQDSASEINAEKSSPVRRRNTDEQMELSPKKNVQMSLRKRNVSDSVNNDNKDTDGESNPVNSINTEKQSGSPQKKIVKKTLKHKHKSGSADSDDADGDEESSPVMSMDTQEQCAEVRSPYTMHQSAPLKMVSEENIDLTMSSSVKGKSKLKEKEITPAKENVKKSPRKKHNFDLSGRLSEINAEKSSPARCRNTDEQMEVSPKKNVQMSLRKRKVSDSVNTDNKDSDGESSPVKSMNTEKQSGSPQKKIVKKTLKHKQKSGFGESDDADGDVESSPVMRIDTQEQCGEVRSPYTRFKMSQRLSMSVEKLQSETEDLNSAGGKIPKTPQTEPTKRRRSTRLKQTPSSKRKKSL